jgi:hypothetical protein
MKRYLALRCSLASLVTALVLAASPAFAQEPKPSASPPAKEAGYGYVFTDDLLAGGVFDPNDVQIRVLRHPMRTTLIRPRTDFVPELLVSVEKL